MEEENLKSPEVKGSEFDVVVVLGGNIRKTKDGKWKTTSFEEGNEKSIGAHSRTLAAAELYKKKKAVKFIVSTGYTVTIPVTDQLDPSAPSEAQVMKDEMIRYGIPEENIIMEDKSDSTLTNAVEVAKILKEHPEFKKVGLLTSFWHLERATVMFESQRLDVLGKMLIPLNSEDIIAAKSSRHAKIVRSMEEKPSTEKRIEAEKRGIEAFKSGAYNSTPHGTNPTKED